MVNIKVLSFDLDGTLTDSNFVDSVWLEGIPWLYSIKMRVSFEDARKAVKREYDEVGKEELQWYNLHYWIKKFDLNISWKDLLKSYKHRIRIYPEVLNVLEELLERRQRLVIITNASTEFFEFELEIARIRDYFEAVFSATSDFGLVKKTGSLYRRVCSILQISPNEMIHVGDDRNFDFEVPRRLGISAYHLDRAGAYEGEYVIHNLEDLKKRLKRF